jgi:hypothetical protein
MAAAPQLTWDEGIQFSLARERESDAFSRVSDDEPESTYWTRDDVERLHAEIGQILFRTMPDAHVEQMGGITNGSSSTGRVGLVRHDFATGDVFEQGGVRIIAAGIQATAQSPFFPCKLVSLAEWVQLEGAGVAHGYYTIFAGTVQHQGWRLRLLYVVEPQLEDFQTNKVLLPPAGYFEMRCDWVHHQLMAADWFPVGRT